MTETERERKKPAAPQAMLDELRALAEPNP